MYILQFIDKYKKFPIQVKASFWFAVSGMLQKGISLLTTPIFSRLLSTEEYGIFSLFITWQNIIIIISSLNLAAGVYLRGLIKYEDDAEEFTRSLQCLYIINTIIVVLVYLFGYSFWDELLDLPFGYMCMMFADIFVQVAFQFWASRERVHFKYKRLVLITLINAVVKPTAGIFSVCVFNNRIDARIYSMVIADIVTFGPFFIAALFNKKGFLSTKYWKYALAYNIPLIPHYLAQIVLNQSDRIMISKMTGTSDAGIYSLAYSAAAIMVIINQSILNTYNPWIYTKIKEKDYDGIDNVSMKLLVIVGVANLFLIVFAPEAISIMAPSSYYQAIWVIPPVAISVFFMFMYSLFSGFEFYYEKTTLMMIASLAGAGLNVFLNYVFIGFFGFIAAGYTTLACYLFYCFFHYCAMKQILKRELDGIKIYSTKRIIKISLLVVIVSAVFTVLYNYMLVRYVLITILLLFVGVNRKRIIDYLQAITMIKKKGE